ncbi:MAG: response regulator [Candidatus Eremiobacterota bacterium]
MHSPPCVLIVDDNLINIKLLAKSLLKESYRVLEAKNGNEGYNLAVSEKPDLILLDIMMPVKDGYEVCEMLKANEEIKDIPVIFITAMTETTDKVRGLSLGAVDYITKPFNSAEVLARVKTQLNLRRMHEENISYQKVLMEAQKIASLGILAEGMAHNFNNLLSVIFCYSEILHSTIEGREKEYVEKIMNSTTRMKYLIKQLLDFAENKKVMPVNLEIQNFLEKVVEFFSESYPKEPVIEIELNIENSEEKIFGDGKLLFQSFLNILINAREAMEHGGKITIKTCRTAVPEILKSKISKLHDIYVCISIADTGKGIKEDDLENIFLPFFTTKNTVGVGLGLSTSYGIIKNHEGIIGAESIYGQGSSFHIYLPVKET